MNMSISIPKRECERYIDSIMTWGDMKSRFKEKYLISSFRSSLRQIAQFLLGYQINSEQYDPI